MGLNTVKRVFGQQTSRSKPVSHTVARALGQNVAAQSRPFTNVGPRNAIVQQQIYSHPETTRGAAQWPNAGFQRSDPGYNAPNYAQPQGVANPPSYQQAISQQSQSHSHSQAVHGPTSQALIQQGYRPNTSSNSKPPLPVRKPQAVPPTVQSAPRVQHAYGQDARVFKQTEYAEYHYFPHDPNPSHRLDMPFDPSAFTSQSRTHAGSNGSGFVQTEYEGYRDIPDDHNPYRNPSHRLVRPFDSCAPAYQFQTHAISAGSNGHRA